MASTDLQSQPTEYMQIEETFAPAVHRITQAIRHRAVYDGPVEPTAEVLTKWYILL
jgi:ATP-dependent DNA helicase 2 subunit 2